MLLGRGLLLAWESHSTSSTTCIHGTSIECWRFILGSSTLYRYPRRTPISPLFLIQVRDKNSNLVVPLLNE